MNNLYHYLTQTAKFERELNHDTPIAGLSDFVLSEGQQWPQGRCKIKRRKLGECYANATKVALAAPHKYRYVEGYGLKPNLVPLLHAWLVLADGSVVDNTWQHIDGTLYYGVAFDAEYLYEAIHFKGTYGLLTEGCMLTPLTLGLEKDYPYKSGMVRASRMGGANPVYGASS